MTSNQRTIMTLTFLGIFLVTAPLVVFFTSGYRYDWKKNTVEKTGLVSISTVPAAAVVSLDGMLQSKKTPALLSRLLPGEYRVRVEKDGYLPWQKTLDVAMGTTTFADGIVLYKDTLPRLIVAGAVVAAEVSADGDRTAYVARHDNLLELNVTSSDQTVLLARFSSGAYKEERLAFAKNGDTLLFAGVASNSTLALTLYPLNGGAGRSLVSSLPDSVRQARWSDDGKTVVVTAANGVYAVQKNGDVAPVSLLTGITDAMDRDGRIVVLRRDGKNVMLERTSGTAATTLAALPASDYSFEDAPEGLLAIADHHSHAMLILDASSGHQLARYDALHVAWSGEKGQERALLWNDFEISVADPRTGASMLVTRLGIPIERCRFDPRGAEVMYSTATGITAIELDDRDRRNVADLVRFTSVGDFFVDPSGQWLRFVGTVGKQQGIYEREL